jgi:23S rRNA pseudouridine1911/1915/1917 synthase
VSAGLLPAGPNQGWIYRDRVAAAAEGRLISAYYAERHRHSGREIWERRLAAGEIHRNGRQLLADAPLVRGDRLAWHRPPWQEPAVPASWPLLFDDGDLHVIAKPSGLPVLPAGGFLEHTLLRLLERRHAGGPPPRPVHRLGRSTSGVLVCARRPASRAWLSAQLGEGSGAVAAPGLPPCRKLYRALLQPGLLALAPGESLPLATPIGRRPHPRLGMVWCAAAAADPAALPAFSRLTLLRRRPGADLVEVAIATGRPHQIRIHCAAAGAPLLGDPLYLPGGLARPEALPGDGGYQLHAWRLSLTRPDGTALLLEAPLPVALEDLEFDQGVLEAPASA